MPKEIIIRFDKPAVICRIQVLAHQYMIRESKNAIEQSQVSMVNLNMMNFIPIFSSNIFIAERIELWIHHSIRGAPTTPSSQTYDFLGFIALSDNSATNYKSRELQSVPVGPKKGTHLKLRLGSPHQNDLNKSNQVFESFPIFMIIILLVNAQCTIIVIINSKNSTGCNNCYQCTR